MGVKRHVWIFDEELLMCPVCKWVITGLQLNKARIDPDCPGCETRKYSEFLQQRPEEE
jgi:hypothetical protein